MSEMRPVEVALGLAAQGLVVVPAPLQSKLPRVEWKKYQRERPNQERLASWFAGRPQNYFVVCGVLSRLLVVDIENTASLQWWRDRLGEVVDRTCAVRTGRPSGEGLHLWFRLPEGLEPERCPRNRSHHEGEIQWDIRGQGGGVLAPPSIHESGAVYSFVEGRGPDAIADCPPELLALGVRGPQAGSKGAGAAGASGGSPAGGGGLGSAPRSLLAHLLANPPVEGGRNDWLARVAGHYAKAHSRMRDLYETEVRRAAAMLEPALPDFEVDKVLESIWQSEQEKGAAVEAVPENGWLVSGGDGQLLCQVRRREGDSAQIGLERWADFDLVAVGVVEDPGAERIYDVLVHRLRQGDRLAGQLPASTLADPRRLRAWLLEFGVTVVPPDTMWPRGGGASERLTRYLESQAPPRYEVVPYMGWHEPSQRFICNEGAISPAGVEPHQGVKPSPRLTPTLAPFRYGTEGTYDDALAVLREVLTFHYETTAAVFASWWVNQFQKPQLRRALSLTPFMAIQSTSESGKTNGFFKLMMQMNGRTGGQGLTTIASFRDALSANQSGIVWIDDANEPERLYEILRTATSEGTVSKKGENRTDQIVIPLVGAAVISGEALQIRDQKALIDRSILIEAPNPASRRSLHDATHPQWDDIVALERRWPDLSALSGWYVQAALRRLDQLPRLQTLIPAVGGRWGANIGFMRYGARLLASILQDAPGGARQGAEIVARVDRWADEQDYIGSENALTRHILPLAIRQLNWPTELYPAHDRWPATPVLVQQGDSGREVWFHPTPLAAWYDEYRRGKTSDRVESGESMAQQARALGPMETKRPRIVTPRHRSDEERQPGRPRYWCLPPDVATAVLDRADHEGSMRGPSGAVHGAVHGVHPADSYLDWPVALTESDYDGAASEYLSHEE